MLLNISTEKGILNTWICRGKRDTIKRTMPNLNPKRDILDTPTLLSQKILG